jgi:hypothetical protein
MSNVYSKETRTAARELRDRLKRDLAEGRFKAQAQRVLQEAEQGRQDQRIFLQEAEQLQQAQRILQDIEQLKQARLQELDQLQRGTRAQP